MAAIQRFSRLISADSHVYEPHDLMSWMPGFMARLDQIEDMAPRLHLPQLEMRASDYMRTRLWHGLINDTAAAYPRHHRFHETLSIVC